MSALDIAIVSYKTDKSQLESTLRSLATAIAVAQAQGVLTSARITVIENASIQAADRDSRVAILRDAVNNHAADTAVLMHFAETNLGYGRANNLALIGVHHDYVLVLNPDVVMDPQFILHALRYLAAHAECMLITPAAKYPNSLPQYLAKRRPDVFTLFLRGFAPTWLHARFAERLRRYERSDVAFDAPLTDIDIASGCCMFIRAQTWRQVGGFDPRFFLYFEDFDLSLRLREFGEIHRVANCRIVHAGGGASRKGLLHIWLFAASMVKYFNRHGWKWF